MAEDRDAPWTRGRFRYTLAIPTRWRDQDAYGHVNNVVYYSLFDTAVNTHLVTEGGLDIRHGPVIGLVVETRCQFLRELHFPGVVDAGLLVTRLGRSSVTYELGLFRDGEADAAARGHFVHVYVDRATRRPVPIPGPIRAALQRLL
jgi:acyl-CoA thioester hydrolase